MVFSSRCIVVSWVRTDSGLISAMLFEEMSQARQGGNVTGVVKGQPQILTRAPVWLVD